MSVEVLLQQTLIIFCYMGIGWIVCKTGVATGQHTKFLSGLITSLTLPLNILASTSLETEPEDLLHMLYAGLLFAGFLAVTTAVSLLISKKAGFPVGKRAIFAGLMAYPNCGFMGIPLCVALMGSWGSLYGAAVVAAYNALYFTWGVSLFHPGRKADLKALITPLNAATVLTILMLALRVHFPPLVQTVFTNVGNMTTPLALIVMGVMLGEGDLLAVFRGKFSYLAVLARNLLCPLALLAVLALLPLDDTLRLALMVYAVMPSANLTAVFATKYDMEAELASRTVVLSTLLSIVTMPLLLILAQRVL